MSRRTRPWLHGITPGGLIVTATVGVAATGLSATACVLYLRGDLEAAKDASLQAAAALSTLVALQARNRPDPAATVEQPATVTATSEDLGT